jgi:hypothetical protein
MINSTKSTTNIIKSNINHNININNNKIKT